VSRKGPSTALLSAVLLSSFVSAAGAWPAETMTAVGRDARRLLPRSLARLLGEREPQIEREVAQFPPALVRALAEDLPSGTLRAETVAALSAEVDRAIALFHERRVSEGLVRLGGLLRISADLSDPVLAVGPEGWPPGLAREYYALFAANLDRMPVVLDDPKALELTRQQLPGFWQSLVDRSRGQVPTIRAELFRGGRVVSHAQLDYRSPAWAMASLAYSRAVTATAATWLAAWREARGDTTRMARPRAVAPQDASAGSLAADRRSPRPEVP
jgi:hypothetical protein